LFGRTDYNNDIFVVQVILVVQSWYFFPPRIVLIEVIFCMKIGHQGSANLEDGIAQPLILEREQTQAENTEHNDDNDSENSHEPARSIASAYRLLTPSVKVSYIFLIVFSLLSITHAFLGN
jgi:hypothetical protein